MTDVIKCERVDDYLETGFGWLSPEGEFWGGTVVAACLKFSPDIVDWHKQKKAANDLEEGELVSEMFYRMYSNGWQQIRLDCVFLGFEQVRSRDGELIPLPTSAQIEWLKNWAAARLDAWGTYVSPHTDPNNLVEASLRRIEAEMFFRQKGDQ